MTIRYSHFPNGYIRATRDFGVSYLSHFPHTHGIELRYTESWDLKTCDGLVGAFRGLPKLIHYLASGESLVGYLRNYPEKPVHWEHQVAIVLKHRSADGKR